MNSPLHLPIFFKVASLALGQSYDCWTVIWLPQCQWCNLEDYGKTHHVIPLWTDKIITTKQSTTKLKACLWEILYLCVLAVTDRIPFLLHDVIKLKHFPSYWPFVRGIHRWPVNSPHKGQWHGALMFSLICAWINGWVNNREAGDSKCHQPHYDVTVMLFAVSKFRCQCLWWEYRISVKGIKNGCPCIVEIRGTQGCALVGDPARAVGECRDVAKAQP